MTKETQNGKNNSETSMIPGFDPTAMVKSFMSKFSDASTVKGNPTAGWLEMNQQWMNFLSERFKRDSALLQKLSKCKNPGEMSAAYMEFSKDAVENYQHEFSEMTKLGQQAIGQLTKASQARTDQMQTKKG
jgi:hypothetical protein